MNMNRLINMNITFLSNIILWLITPFITIVGYMRDASRLYNFFRVTLNYDVFNFTNCSRDDIFKTIADIRQHIKENGCYDRLVFVISTHGDEVY